MKKLFLLVVAGALLLAPHVEARDGGRGFRPGLQAQGETVRKGPPPGQRGERDKKREHDKRHQGRLTEEQRQGLHRDLDRANREIYRR